MPFVYILKCSDGSYYTGSATDMDRRLYEHQQGIYGGYTASRRPVEVVYCAEMRSDDEAFLFERQIKGWSRRKKEALIAGRYDLLPQLSRTRRPRSGGR